MTSKKKLLKNSLLYLILDKDVCSEKKLPEVMEKAARGGADIIQFRDKTSSTRRMIELARPLVKIASSLKKIFIVNDRIEVAVAVDADGIHLGQDDAPVGLVRGILGKGKIIGISCHSLQDIKEARELGADYAGFGPVFKTKTKPLLEPKGIELLEKCLLLSNLPVFPIGGIEQGNLGQVVAAGARRMACCREICLSSAPQKTARLLKTMLEKC